MPSILVLCEYATLNGGERSMLSTLEGVARGGYQVRVAAPANGPLAEVLRNKGVEVVPFESRDGNGAKSPLRELCEKLAGILREHRPALLHANSLSMGRLSGPVTAELGIPSLSHLRDIVTLSRQVIANLNCHRRLLAVSMATKQFHVAQGLADEKTWVLHNGIDLEQFAPRLPTGYLHQELGLAEGVPLIGTIGQISLRKGHDILAAALTEIAAETGFAWLVVGQRYSGKEESRQFEERLHHAAAGPLAGKVHFLGTRDDVGGILNELALLVHPARQEPLGRVLLEAAASGVAIVATDVGGTREIFPSECVAACLVPPNDVPAMSEAVIQLLADAAQRQRLAANARTRARRAYPLQWAVDGLLEHYAQLIE